MVQKIFFPACRTTKGLSKALVISLLPPVPLILADNLLTRNFHLIPILRVPALLGVFAVCFLGASRALSAFTEDDFDLLENALPRFLSRPLRFLEILVVRN